MTSEAFDTIAERFDPPLVIVTTAAGDTTGRLRRRLPLAVQHRPAALRRVAVQGQPHLPGGRPRHARRRARPDRWRRGARRAVRRHDRRRGRQVRPLRVDVRPERCPAADAVPEPCRAGTNVAARRRRRPRLLRRRSRYRPTPPTISPRCASPRPAASIPVTTPTRRECDAGSGEPREARPVDRSPRGAGHPRRRGPCRRPSPLTSRHRSPPA